MPCVFSFIVGHIFNTSWWHFFSFFFFVHFVAQIIMDKGDRIKWREKKNTRDEQRRNRGIRVSSLCCSRLKIFFYFIHFLTSERIFANSLVQLFFIYKNSVFVFLYICCVDCVTTTFIPCCKFICCRTCVMWSFWSLLNLLCEINVFENWRKKRFFGIAEYSSSTCFVPYSFFFFKFNEFQYRKI